MKHHAGRFVSEKTDLERFEEKYITEPNTGCWLWIARVNRDGYGQFYFDGSMRTAHRVSYELYVGPIPHGLDLDHTCHNGTGCKGGITCIHRRCVNWAHTEPVSRGVNTKRSVNTIASRNMGATHCPSGHPYDEVNTWIQVYKSKRHGRVITARICRVCKNQYEQKRGERRSAA